MTNDFSHFLDAQAADFSTAMAELRAGKKVTHWIWYVFPQLAGLGSSSLARRFALPDPAAARAYLRHPILRARLLNATGAVHEQVCGRGAPLSGLLGAHIDALKLVSSMTLFGSVAASLNGPEPSTDLATLAKQAEEILGAAERQGFRRCGHTERALTLGGAT